MKSQCVLAVLMTILCYFLVPSADAASLARSQLRRYYSGIDGVPYTSHVDKRNKGVDAWSICPPQMTDVDCFYAYLRVYARLRKAAEESDRVSMRNIGKRSSVTSSSESARAKSRVRLMHLCPDDSLPVHCYQAIKQLYRRVLTSMHTPL